MKKIIAGSLFMFAATHVMAACTQVNANAVMGKVTLGCIKITGAANLNGTTIKKNLDLKGPLLAKAAQLNELNIEGNVNLNQTTVSGKSRIHGNLQATDTTFRNTIQLTAAYAMFNHSTLENLQITSNKPAYVFLNKQSTVNGNITFTKGNGIVKNNSSIIKGKIIGGKIEK